MTGDTAAGPLSDSASRSAAAAALDRPPVVAPLPFDPVDVFFLLFEGCELPVTGLWAFRVSGEALDEARLLRATEQTFARHPKAASRLEIHRQSRFREKLFWVPIQDAARTSCRVHAPQPAPADGDAPFDALTTLLNLPLESGDGPLAQIHWIPHAREEGTLIFRFHHALCDGHGALVFLEDLFGYYNGHPPPTPPPDYWAPPAPQVPDRGLARLRLLGRLIALQFWRATRYRFASQTKLFDLQRRGAGRIRTLGRTIGPEKLAGYLAKSRAMGCTVNDLLLAAHGLALERWLGERGLKCGMLRCLVNQNLRPRAAKQTIVCNRSSVFPVWMGPQDRRSARALVASIHQQVRECIDGRIAEATAVSSGGLRLPLRWARRLVQWAATQPMLSDSLVISNVGRLPDSTPGSGWFYLGSGRILSVHAAVRPAENIGAVSVAATAGGRLGLDWSFLSGLFNDSEVRRVLELLEEALDELTR